MLLKLKNYIKHKTPRVYDKFRNICFPVYLNLRNSKVKNFDRKVKNIKFAGVKYKLVLNKDNGFVDEEIYWKGVYEEEVMLALQKEIMSCISPLPKSWGEVVFLDIGSNIGQELIFAGAAARDILNKNNISFKAIGFEPIKSLYEQVKESIQINNFKQFGNTTDINKENIFVDIKNFALGDKDEELILKSPIINVGGSSLVRNENNTVGEIREEKIIVKRGDGIVFNILNEINLENKEEKSIKLIIKIDVEGFEYEVMKGLSETIKKYKPIIIIEYSPTFYIRNSAMGDRSKIGIELLQILKEESYIMEIIDIGEYKNKIYKGEEIINWGRDFRGEQANLLLYKI